jgi:hypothetical protein
MSLHPGLLWLTLHLALIIQWLSWNNFFLNLRTPPRYLRVPPGVRVPQVEYHWTVWYIIAMMEAAVPLQCWYILPDYISPHPSRKFLLDFICYPTFSTLCCRMSCVRNAYPDVQNVKHWLLLMANYGGSYAALIKILISCQITPGI